MPEVPQPPPPVFHAMPVGSLMRRAVLGFLLILVLAAGLWSYEKFIRQNRSIGVGASEMSLTAEKQDALGVDPATTFVLASKKPLDLDNLKASLTVSPKTEYAIAAKSAKEYQISFAKPLAANSIYTFAMATDAREASSAASSSANLVSWAFQVKTPFRVVQTLPRDKATSVPTNSGIEITFNHENFTEAEKYIEITPNVTGHWEIHKRTLVFAPRELAPATLYTVRVKKGLEITGTTDTLGEDAVFQFETQVTSYNSNRLQINFVREMSEFAPGEKPAFSLYLSEAKRVPTVDVAVYKFTDEKQFLTVLSAKDKIPVWAHASRDSYRYPSTSLTRVANFTAPVQELGYGAYFLFPDTMTAGFYLVEAAAGGQTIQTLLQVTDVATYLTTSRTKTLVWVNDLATKNSVNKAKIELLGQSASNFTTEEGVTLFDTPKELIDTDTRRYFKVTTPSGKMAIVPVSQTNEGYSRYYGGWQSHESPGREADNYWAYLYLDRPVYLPTDSIGFWGLVKNRDNPLEPKNLTLVLTRSYYQSYNDQPLTIAERQLTFSDMGTFVGELPIKNLETGSYQLEVRKDKDTIMMQSFTVETYTKPAYKIEVETNKKAVFAGETVEFSGKTRFFEGTSVPNVRLKYSGARDGEATSGKNGEFSINYTPAYEPPAPQKLYNLYPKADSLSVVPALAEEGDIQGESSVRVFGPHLDLTAKSENNVRGSTVTVTAHKITLDRINDGSASNESDYLGEPLASLAIKGQLYENHWEKKEVGEYYDFINKVTAKKYDYNLVRNFKQEIPMTTDALGKAIIDLPQPGEDSYFDFALSAADSDGRVAQTSVYLSRGARNLGQESALYYLEAGNNAEHLYKTGETVALAFKNQKGILPTGGDNHYLFRLAARGIRDFKVQSAPNFTFPFSDSDIPNVVAKGIYFNGQTYIESESLSLAFDQKDRQLSIDVSPDKASYVPRDRVNLDISVKDKNGAGQTGEINLSLVDESIFKIQEQSVDLLGDLYRSVESGVIQSYQSHQYPTDLPRSGGGGGCFLPGTKIQLPGNRQINIEEVKTGTTILTRISETEAKLVPARVSQVLQHVVNEYLLVNGHLRVTPEHNLYVNGRWMVAGDLRVGDKLLDKNNQWITVTSIERRQGTVTVYNLMVETYHTFIADGFYVHNQKGRELFTDRAFFGSVKTDASGKGRVSFTLPDNLTSWRMTYQGVTGDLKAGNSNKLLPVKLPFFVDLVMNTEYLDSDAPILGLRAYGEKLAKDQDVTFKVKIPTLGQTDVALSGHAFETVPLTLPKLSEGQHKISVEATAGSLKDTITRPFTVYKSRLVKAEVKFASLTSDLHLEGSQDSATTLLFSDANRGRYYPTLTRLTYTYGDRIDQKLARVTARKLLQDYFSQDLPAEETIKGDIYQQSDGGISLFPYSDSDLALSAKIADSAPEYFDRLALAQYFYKILEANKTSREEGIKALYGLASLGESVLTQINQLAQVSDLTILEKLDVALGEAKLGNREIARGLYHQIISQSGEKIDPYIRIKTGQDQDDILQPTATSSRLAALLGEPEASRLFAYLEDNYATDILVYFEELAYLKDVLPALPGQAIKFTYSLGGKKETKTLAHGETFRLRLSPDELAAVHFDEIQGNVGVASFYTAPFAASTIARSGDLSLTRNFAVNGQPTTNFSEADLVKITLDYRFGMQSIAGCYQVSDWLPSGLRVITQPYLRGINDQNVWYPYDITGQRVNFCVSGNYKPIVYYARVLGKGDYQAENALIQSMQSPSVLNLSNSERVTIR